MKLSLKRTILVSAVLMTLSVVRILFSEVIYDFLLEGHPIRTIVFNDMMFCVVAMAIALFFWGLWKYRDEMPRLEKRSVFVLIGSVFLFVVLYFAASMCYNPTFTYFQLVYRATCMVAFWYFYHLVKTSSGAKECEDSYNSHYYALMIAIVLFVTIVALVVSDVLWYFVSADYFGEWHIGASSISILTFVLLLFWVGSLAMPWLERTEIGEVTDKMVFEKKQQMVAKISIAIFVGLVLYFFALRLGVFGIWYAHYNRYVVGGVVLIFCLALLVCWFYNAMCFVQKKTPDSWLKRFNVQSLCLLGGVVPLTCFWFGLGEILNYETDLLDNEVLEIIYGLIFIILFIGILVIIFASWLCNTFVVFMLSGDGFVFDESRFRRIKKIFWWGVVVLVVVGALNIGVEYVKRNALQEEEQNERYRLKHGDLQYSDSIVINTTWRKNKVYNINTKKYLHEEEIDDILRFNMVSESKIVYVDSAYKRGYLNVVTGEIDIKAEYDYAWLFSEGVAAVVKDDKIGFIDKDNNVVIPFQYPMYASYAPYTYRFYSGYCKMTDEEGRCGLIDHSGKWVIEPKYQRIKKPVFGKYRKVKLNDKWGLLDENLKLILPVKYDYITVLDSMATRFEVTYEGKMYELDRSGKLLKQIDYSYMHPFYEPKGRYSSFERTSGRYMQVWVRQENEVDYNREDYSFSLDYDLKNCGLDFRTGIIDVIENRIIVPVEYCEIEFDNLPKEIDKERSLVFKCIGPHSRGMYYRTDEERITLGGKKVRVKYE